MDEVRKILEGLMQQGLLQPASIVEAAKSQDSPLHSYFQWDDTEAAKLWRLQQARQLIRSMTIQLIHAPAINVRAFVSLPTDRDAGSGYRHISEVMSNDFMRKQLCAEIENQIKNWCKRASALGLEIDASSFSALLAELQKAG